MANNNNQIRGNWFSSIAEKSDFNMTITKDTNEPQPLKWEIGDILVDTLTDERWVAYEVSQMWWTDVVSGERYQYPTLHLYSPTRNITRDMRIERLNKTFYYNESLGETPPSKQKTVKEVVKLELSHMIQDQNLRKTSEWEEEKEEERAYTKRWATESSKMIPTHQWEEAIRAVEDEDPDNQPMTDGSTCP